MAFPRPSRMRLIWWLELGLGLELYACAVLALHARGLRATPLMAAPSLVIPALVIPPVFYVLVGLISMRPLSMSRVFGAAAAMCGLHTLLVVVTGALYTIPDLVDFGDAIAFALWGSPAVTLLQLTAAPLVFARLRPLLPFGRPASRARAAMAQRRAETPGSATARTLGVAPSSDTVFPDPRGPVVTAPTAQHAPAVAREPFVAPAAARLPVATPPPSPPSMPVRPAASRSVASTRAETAPALSARRPAQDSADAMVRVPFSRIADQLPVEMFVRGRDGLNATLRPGVSLLVPRHLILRHLGEGLAPVAWQAVADQFPRDELALSHDQIAKRLPNGSLLLPLDEVVPQIPIELLALSTPAVDVYGIEEFPAPFQPHVSQPSESAPGDDVTPVEPAVAAVAAPTAIAADQRLEDPVAAVDEPDEPVEPEPADEPEVLTDPEAAAEPESSSGREIWEEPEIAPEPERSPTPALAARASPPDVPVERVRTDAARRVAALLAPRMNGLEIGERDDGETTLITVVEPPLSEESVAQAAGCIAPYLTDARLPEPVTQATFTCAEATIVVTPLGSPEDGGALLVAALASRTSLAWLERLSRSAAGDASPGVGNGRHAGSSGDGDERADLRATVVPPSVRELAGSLTAFGPVAPTVLRDPAGALRACLFLPRTLEALPLARFARDLYAALEGSELGEVSSVTLRVGAQRVVLRAMDGASGEATMLVGAGPVDRPGLARIELDRAATRLGALVRS